MNCGIYKIINTVNGKVYVGSSININRRVKEHIKCLKGNYKNSNEHLQRSWNKYGKYSFIFEVLLYCDKENLVFYEQRAINQYKSLDNKFGYNMCPAKRTNLLGSNTIERSIKISEALKGKYIGENHWNYGKKLSEETIQNMKVGAKKRLKISLKTKEILSKNSAMAKPIIINNKEYPSRIKAAKDLGIKYSKFLERLKKGITGERLLKKGNNRRNQNGKNNNMWGNKGKDNWKTKTVIANGKQYDSSAEAAQDLKVCRQTITYRIKTNKEGYKYV